jgi:hypothetical protein
VMGIDAFVARLSGEVADARSAAREGPSN